jgi:hypothetical protein
MRSPTSIPFAPAPSRSYEPLDFGDEIDEGRNAVRTTDRICLIGNRVCREMRLLVNRCMSRIVALWPWMLTKRYRVACCRYLCSCCASEGASMSFDQALALMQEGLIFMRHEAGRVPIPVWLSLEDNNSVLSWRSCGTPSPPPPHSLSIAFFNGARALESSDAQAKPACIIPHFIFAHFLTRSTPPQCLGPSIAVDAALVRSNVPPTSTMITVFLLL